MKGDWRTGRKVGRTIYRQVGDEPSDDDVLIGVMDTRELAADVVRKRAVAPYTVAQMRAIVENAERICAADASYDPGEVPWYIGLISTAPPDEAALALGRRLAERHGW